MQENARALYEFVRQRYPAGILNKEFLPACLAEQALELRCFTEHRAQAIEFAFFRTKHRYARKTLVVYSDGRVELDEGGVIPAFDQDPLDDALQASVADILSEADRVMRGATS
jgi:hypothetical protein